jgi:hypothetical protein
VAAQESRDADAESRLDVQRQRSDEATARARYMDLKLASRAVVPPPRLKPRMHQERARSRHRAHERVPFALERGERCRIRYGRDRQWIL